MTKTNIFIISGLVVVTVVAGIVLSKKPMQSNPQDGEQVSLETNGTSFADFLERGEGSYECQVSQYIDGSMAQSVDGTVFIHDGMIRGEYAVEVAGIALSTSLIVKDGFVHTWTSMAPLGVKVPVDRTVASESDAPMAGSYGWNADLIGSYECVDWTPDLARFELPTNINFQEL